jgi:2-(1,2-epoxy-1,2-dihydrophenyl)acetyl-CoA isomerase
MEDVLLESLDAGLLTLTMNRPESRNAINTELAERLLDAVSRAAANPDVRALVLTGAGNAFCAGGDVKSMAAASGQSQTFDQRVRGLRVRMDVSRLLHEMPKPTVAVVRGAAAGAGLSLALACDLRIASPSAKFVTAFARVGLSGDYGGAYFLSRIVGGARARELYLLGTVLGAAEAQAIGLVNRIYSEDEIAGEVGVLAGSLASGPSVALGYIKENLNLAEYAPLGAVFDAEAIRHIRCAGTDDHKEAAQAFVEKRAPLFKGR